MLHNVNLQFTKCIAYKIYPSDPLSVPILTVNAVTSTGVEYRVEMSDTATTRVITGYDVFRFGVPMLGEYDHAGTRRTVTISPVVPGAQYRITAWALDDGTRRSATPAVQSVTTGGTSEYRHRTQETSNIHNTLVHLRCIQTLIVLTNL